MRQVGNYLGEEIINQVLGGRTTEDGESLADRFELIWGADVSSSGVESIVLEFQVDGPWYIQGERDIFGDPNVGAVYRIRFKWTILGFSTLLSW